MEKILDKIIRILIPFIVFFVVGFVFIGFFAILFGGFLLKAFKIFTIIMIFIMLAVALAAPIYVSYDFWKWYKKENK